MRFPRLDRQLVVGHEADDEDGLTRLDFVAGGQHGFLDFSAVQQRTVGALFIEHAATVSAAFYGKVYAGHVVIVGDGKLCAVGSAADRHGFAGADRNAPAGEWSTANLEQNAQGEVPAAEF